MDSIVQGLIGYVLILGLIEVNFINKFEFVRIAHNDEVNTS